MDAGKQPTSGLNLAQHPVVEFPIGDIVVNKDIKQFKENGDAKTGVVEPLGGSYERLGTAPVILWQKLNGETEIITGRHRLDLARRTGEQTIPAQVVSEKDGFTQKHALTFDAESNIRDGQGTVKDYASYFRNCPDILHADADSRGLLRGAKGNAGWHLGRDGSEGLFTLYANNEIREDKAVAIARGAPGNEAAQTSAIRQAGKLTAGELEMYARNLARMAPGAEAGAGNQLGFDGISPDFASYEATAAKLAAVQAKHIGENSQLIAAARGAAKNPEAAEKMGLPVKDPEALRARIAQLEADNARLRNPDPEAWDALHIAAGLPVPPRADLAPPAPEATPGTPPADDPNIGALFEPDPSRQTVLSQQRAFLESAPVVHLTGNEFEKEAGTSLIDRVATWFKTQIGGQVAHPQIGTVVLNRQGVKDSWSHGGGRFKAAAFAAVPEVIRQGRILDVKNNWKGRGYDTVVLGAPIEIGGQHRVAVVVVTRKSSVNQFYLHEAYLTENLQGGLSFKTGALQQAGAPSGDVEKLLRDIFAVNPEHLNEPEAFGYGIDRLSPETRAKITAEVQSRVAALTTRGQIALASRATQLRQTSIARPLTPTESAELDAVDVALGQGALPFDPPKPAQVRRDVGIAYNAARAQLDADAAAPLRAADLQTQSNLFDEPGQLALFERRRHSYEDPRQLSFDIGADIALLVAPDHPVSGKSILHSGPQGTGKSVQSHAGDIERAANRRRFLHVRGKAFASALISDGQVRFIGQEVRSPEDLARYAQVLRNPRFETFYVIPMQGNRVVGAYAVTSRIPFTTSAWSKGGSIEDIKRVMRDTAATGYYLLHNHPSTNIDPSAADRSLTEYVYRQIPGMHAHVVIDHYQYAVLQVVKADFLSSINERVVRQSLEFLPGTNSPDPLWTPDQPHPALGQVVTSSNHDAVAQFGAALGDTGRAVSLFFVQANRITKVATLADLSEDTLSQAGLAPLIRAHALEAGAQGAVAYYDGGDDLVSARLLALVSNGTLLDVNFGSGKPTARSMVVMPPTRDVLWGSAMDSAVRVQEPDAYSDLPAYDETAPIIVRAGRRGAYVNVPLARLKDIPIVQMPELVRLAKLLTGRVPTIKQLSRALGQFDSAQVTITLDPRIFRNSSIAAKVMAHEFGHLTDFLPDQTLARGNILGRIASLKNYLSTTLPLDPKSGNQALTPAERSSLRKQAEKLAGPKPAKDEEADRAAWNEEVSKHYAELLQAELKSRGLIVASSRERGGLSVIGASKSLVGIREELIGLTEYWKPIPENAPLGYVAYRYSGVELYADAISVLLNSPATLKELAPTFYEAFFNHLDAKPEYKKALMDLYDFLNKPHLQVLNQRSRDIQAMFIKGDALILAKAAERKARYATFRGWMDRFRQELFDVFDPLVAKGHALERSGTAINPRYNPRFLFDEHPLADNANYEMVQHLWENVVKPVEADGFTLNDLGEYLFLQRVLNERLVTAELPPGNVAAWKRAMTAAAYINDPVKRAGEMQRLQNVLSEWEAGENNGRSGTANPGGTTPETARLGLLRMRLDSGWERFARLEIAAAKFHDIVFEQMRAAVAVGVYSQKAFDERLAPNRQHYAAFAVLDYLQDYVPASIRMSVGTFKDIANPFTATVLKMVSVNRLIQTQKSKLGTVEFLQQFDAANVTKAPVRHDGVRLVVQPSKDPDKALLDLLEDGKPAGYYVDPAIAEMFDKLSSARISAVVSVLNLPFRKLIYPLIIKYNPAFQLVLSPVRDLRRTLINVPRAKGVAQVGEFLRNYLTFLGLPPSEAGTAVRAYLKGEPHPLIAEMIATQAIGTPLDNFHADFGRADTMEKTLADFGMAPKAKQPGLLHTMTHPLMALLERIEFAGLTFEMLPKVGVYKMLTRDLGWSTKEAAYFVRNSIGVPNIYRKGKHTAVAEVVFPFTKIFVNGWRSDARLALGPKTAGGWWARWAAGDGIWTMMQAAAALGLLGAGIKELYDGISDYNKTNYNVLPIGTSEGGEFGKRVVYIRLPRDETHRLVSGLLYQGMMLAGGQGSPKGVGSMLAFGAGQMPSLNPILTIAKGWTDYLEGDNPKDNFRGNTVLSNAEYLAGGWPAMKSMIGFTADNMGVTNFVRWDANANSTMEMALSAVPGVNRFIQTTATGYRERQEATLQAEAADRARLRLSMPANVQTLAGEYYHLRSIKADVRTLEQTTRLMELQGWMKRTYQQYEDVIGMGAKDAELMKRFEEASKPYERGR